MAASPSPPNDGQHSCDDTPAFPYPASLFAEAWRSCVSYTDLVRFLVVMIACWTVLLTVWFGNEWWTRRKLHIRLHTYLRVFWILTLLDVVLNLVIIYRDKVRTDSSSGSNQGTVDISGLVQVIVQGFQRAYFLYLALAISKGVGIVQPQMTKAERGFSLVVAMVGFLASIRATEFSNSLAVGNFVWMLVLVYVLRLMQLGFSQCHLILWHMTIRMESMRIAIMDASISGVASVGRSPQPQSSLGSPMETLAPVLAVDQLATAPDTRRDPSLTPNTTPAPDTAITTTNITTTPSTAPLHPILSPEAAFMPKIKLLQRTKFLLVLYILFQLVMQIVNAKLPILYQIYVTRAVEWLFSAGLVSLFWLREPMPFRLVPCPDEQQQQPVTRNAIATASSTTTNSSAMAQSRRRLERLARVVAHATADPAVIIVTGRESTTTTRHPPVSPFATAPPISHIRLISQPPYRHYHHNQLRLALAQKEVE